MSDKFLDDLGAVEVQPDLGTRADGTPKGTGFLGIMERPDGGVSSEVSVGVNIDGKETEIPAMVSTLTQEEVDYLLNTKATPEMWDTDMGKGIVQKAVDHAKGRMAEGKSPFYQEGEDKPEKEDFLDIIGAKPISEEEISAEKKPDMIVYLSDIDQKVSFPAYMTDDEINNALRTEVYSRPEEDTKVNPKNVPEKINYALDRFIKASQEFVLGYDKNNPETLVGKALTHPSAQVLMNWVDTVNYGITQIPAYMFELSQVMGVKGLHLDKLAGMQPMQAPEWMRNNDVAKYYKESADANNFLQERFQGKGFKDIVKSGDKSEVAKYIGWNLFANAPYTLALIGSAMTGVGEIALVGVGLLEASQAQTQNIENGVDLIMATYDATLKGVFESAFEYVGTFGLLKAWEGALAKSFGKGGAKEILMDVGKMMASVVLGEGNEEAGTTFAQSVTDYSSGVDPDAMKDLGWKMLDSFVQGALSGLLFTAPSAVVGGVASNEARKSNAKKEKMRKLIGEIMISKTAENMEKSKEDRRNRISLEIIKEKRLAEKGEVGELNLKEKKEATPKEKPTVPSTFENMVGDETEILDYLAQYIDPKIVASLTNQERLDLSNDVNALIEFANNPDINTIRQVEKNKAVKEVKEAVADGRTDEAVAQLAEYLITQIDSSFNANSSIEFSKEVLEATDEILKSEGITREKGKKYYITGDTVTRSPEKDILRTAIRLYNGHDADTLVEEWYHRAFDRLSEEEKLVFADYHRQSGDKRSIHEHFAQEGRDYFFKTEMYKGAGTTIEKLFEKAKKALQFLMERIAKLDKAKIPKRVREMYRQAGTPESVREKLGYNQTKPNIETRIEMYKRMFDELAERDKAKNGRKTKRSVNASNLEAENIDSVVPPPPVSVGYGIKNYRENWIPKALNYMKKNGVSEKNIQDYMKAIEASIAIHEALLKKADAMDLFPDMAEEISGNSIISGAIRENSDKLYKYSFDASGMCVKRLIAVENMREIEKVIKRPMTTDEVVFLILTMQEAGFQTPCIYCYVESPRQAMGEYSDNFSHFVVGDKPLFITNSIDPDAYDKKTGESLSAKNFEFRKKIMKMGIKYEDIDQRVLTDPDYFIEQLKDKNSHLNKYPELYKWLAQKVTGSTRANNPKAYGEYVGQILRMPKKDIAFLNSNAGFRFFSISDFQIEHMPDLMQAIFDGNLVGLQGHAYTKVADFVEIFGNTNMKVNMSIFAEERNGEVIEDNMNGMAWKDAKRLRKKFDGKDSNVGVILVGTTDAIIEWGLNQDWVDYIIPFHRSGMEVAYMEKLGWKDYEQKEKKNGKPFNLHIGDVMDMTKGSTDADIKKKYLAYTKKHGIDPKFKGENDRFLNHPNYAKLLKDFSRTDTPYKKLKPNFNMKYATKLLEDFINAEGSHYESDKDIVKQVSKAIKKNEGTNKSLALEALEARSEQRSFQVKDFDINKPLYHGTTAEFTELDFVDRKRQGSNLFADYREAPKSKVIYVAENRQNAEYFGEWQGKGKIRTIEVQLSPKAKVFDFTRYALPYPSTAEDSKVAQEQWNELEKIHKKTFNEINEGGLDMQDAMNDPAFRQALRRAGYDAVRFIEPEGRGITLGIINKDAIQSQMDITKSGSLAIKSRADIYKNLQKLMPQMKRLPVEYDSINGRRLAPSFDIDGRKVRLGLVYDRIGNTIGLYYIAIETGSKGGGLGTKIINNLKRIATENKMRIDVFPSSNHPFWRKQGFIETGGFGFSWMPEGVEHPYLPKTSYQVKEIPQEIIDTYNKSEESRQKLIRLESGQLSDAEVGDVTANNRIQAEVTRLNNKLGQLIKKYYGDDPQKQVDIRTQLQQTRTSYQVRESGEDIAIDFASRLTPEQRNECFTGGCFTYADVLSKKTGGEILVLSDQDGNGIHAVVRIGNKVFDASGETSLDMSQYEDENTDTSEWGWVGKDDLQDRWGQIVDKKLFAQLTDIWNKAHESTSYPVFKQVRKDGEVNYVATINGKSVSMFRNPENGWWYDTADIGSIMKTPLGFNKEEATKEMVRRYGGTSTTSYQVREVNIPRGLLNGLQEEFMGWDTELSIEPTTRSMFKKIFDSKGKATLTQEEYNNLLRQLEEVSNPYGIVAERADDDNYEPNERRKYKNLIKRAKEYLSELDKADSQTSYQVKPQDKYVEQTDIPLFQNLLSEEEFPTSSYETYKEYMAKAKGMEGKIVYMSPDDYMKYVGEGFFSNTVKSYGSEEEALKYWQDGGYEGDTKEEIIDKLMEVRIDKQNLERIRKFDKVYMPYLEYTKGYFSQEGHHRAMVAKEEGVEKIPVLVVYDTGKFAETGVKGDVVSHQIRVIDEESSPVDPEPSDQSSVEDIIDYVNEGWSEHYERTKVEFGFNKKGEKYGKISINEEEKKAFELAEKDPEMAKRIAFGIEDGDTDTETQAIRRVVKKALLSAGKVAEAEMVARIDTKKYTEMGQALNIAKLDISPERKVRIEVYNERLRVLGGNIWQAEVSNKKAKNKIKDHTVSRAKEVTEKVRERIDPRQTTIQQIDSLIEELIC